MSRRAVQTRALLESAEERIQAGELTELDWLQMQLRLPDDEAHEALLYHPVATFSALYGVHEQSFRRRIRAGKMRGGVIFGRLHVHVGDMRRFVREELSRDRTHLGEGARRKQVELRIARKDATEGGGATNRTERGEVRLNV